MQAPHAARRPRPARRPASSSRAHRRTNQWRGVAIVLAAALVAEIGLVVGSAGTLRAAPPYLGEVPPPRGAAPTPRVVAPTPRAVDPAPGVVAPAPRTGAPTGTPRPAPRPAPTSRPSTSGPVARTRPVAPVPAARPGIVAITPRPQPTPAPIAAPSSGGTRGGGASRSSGGSPSRSKAKAPSRSGGLPTCAYLDETTAHRGYGDWGRTLLDTIYRLPSGYAPPDLVDSSAAGLNDGYPIRRLVVDDLRAMAAAAREAGAPIEVVSGYRSYATQQATFERWVKVDGRAQALKTSARAGHSEHQLGTTIDVTSRGGNAPWSYGDWATTKAGAWIAANSWRYGFVVSYPRGKSARTCYSYEPWHLRYFGRERAAAIRGSGLTAREFLWRLR